MLQAVMTEPGKIEFNDVEVPAINADQILVKIKKIGVCGSDIHVYRGKHPYTSYPVVQGHEVAGEIEKIGANVTGFTIGDRVTIQPQVVCGTCYNCTHGMYNVCDSLKVMGFQTTGMASEYFAVDAKKALKFSNEMSYDEGAMIEPLAVAIHAVNRGGSVDGKKILVLGAGPIGNLIAQTAKGMGASKVIITDLSDYRLNIAKECGVDVCLNTARENVTDAIAEHFGPDRADMILECVGVNKTMEQAISNARKGSNIVVVGVFEDLAKVDLGFVQDRELKLVGTLMYREEDYVKAIELIEAKKVHLNPLITNHFAFKDYLAAYDFIEKQKDQTMKVIINIEE
ncbi:MAG: alcohol dehydrogenase [Spartobacteria bacterium]|nr:alcohol dehydrogenase [Spartobacteria bacterium]